MILHHSQKVNIILNLYVLICTSKSQAQKNCLLCTAKSLSEALILTSTNPKYDDRLFIELRVQYKKNASSEHVVYKNCFCFDNIKIPSEITLPFTFPRSLHNDEKFGRSGQCGRTKTQNSFQKGH